MIDVVMTVPQPTGNGTPWQAPIGVPVPPFGIEQTHMMFKDKTYLFNGVEGPYNDAGNGPYTHYLDNTNPLAVDSYLVAGKSVYNYGTPEKPRKTIPPSLTPGSVVEIHGGPYTIAPFFQISGQGTLELPIFIRGVGLPRLAKKLSVCNATSREAMYMIVEGLDVYKFEVIAPASYIVLRDCNVQGDAVGGGMGLDSYSSSNFNHHLIFVRNKVHDNGNWLADFDQDVHGMCIARRTSYVWILDSEFYHNSGDGLQINAGSMTAQPDTHHIFVGRNLSHHNKQSGMWIKQATDVVFTQNTVYGLRPIGTKPSAYGAGMGFQYGPERVWFLYNHIYDCCFGISSGSTSGMGFGQDSYYIGNLIHDIHHDPSYSYTPTTAWSNAGITLVGAVNKYIINNTIYNCDAGINTPSNGKIVAVNNIIGNITDPQGNHVFVESGPTATASELLYNLFYQGGGAARIRWGSSTVYSLPGFQAVFGKATDCRMGDPLFTDPVGKDYTLQAGSEAIDHATAWSAYTSYRDLYGVSIDVDATNRPRPQGAGWDNGAFEYHAAEGPTSQPTTQPAG